MQDYQKRTASNREELIMVTDYPYPNRRDFYNACDVIEPLNPQKQQQYMYYTNFDSVRGGEIIEGLKNNIQIADRPTYQLFTGHFGCGKSTELLRLKDKLEKENNVVVYVNAQEEVDIQDLQINDLLLGIAHQISEQSLKNLPENFREACFNNFQNIFRQMGEILGTRLEITEIGLSVGLATITAQLRDSSGNSQLRNLLRARLGVTTPTIIKAINEELIATVKQKLEQQSEKKLIVIVDDLDKLNPSSAESIFLDQGRLLRKLQCDIVYTFPLALRFSNIFFQLAEQFTDTSILPMIPIWYQNGSQNEDAIQVLVQMVLKRAFPLFPRFEEPDLTRRIRMIFDSSDSLNKLCIISSGNLRLLFLILRKWIVNQENFPLLIEKLEDDIQERLNELRIAITDDEWALLRKVVKTKKLAGEEKYQQLIYSQFVYEYRERDGLWYKVNPILAQAPEMRQEEEE